MTGEVLRFSGNDAETPEKLDRISSALITGRRRRAAYKKSLGELATAAEWLKGKQGLISGRIHGKRGSDMYTDNSSAQISRLHIAIEDAQLYTREGGDVQDEDLPCLALTVHPVEDKSQVLSTYLHPDWATIEVLPVPAEAPESQ